MVLRLGMVALVALTQHYTVDQRDIQRLGGRCVRFPVSCLIKRMLSDIGLDVRKLVVLDVTYGEGRFYGAWRPALLLASDVRILDWVVEPDWFAKTTSWNAWRRVRKLGVNVDLVVVDPPFTRYRRGHEKRSHYMPVTAIGTPHAILEGGVETAEKIGARHVLVHYNEIIDFPTWKRVYTVDFKFMSRYLKQDANNTTYFYILEPTHTAKIMYRGSKYVKTV